MVRTPSFGRGFNLLIITDAILNQASKFREYPESKALAIPFAIESCWVTGKYDVMKTLVPDDALTSSNFNIGLGQVLLALASGEMDLVSSRIADLQMMTAQGLNVTNTSSLQECHGIMMQLHVLVELDAIAKASQDENFDKAGLLRTLNQRLDILGPFLADKQYICGIRRAAMHLTR